MISRLNGASEKIHIMQTTYFIYASLRLCTCMTNINRLYVG